MALEDNTIDNEADLTDASIPDQELGSEVSGDQGIPYFSQSKPSSQSALALFNWSGPKKDDSGNPLIKRDAMGRSFIEMDNGSRLYKNHVEADMGGKTFAATHPMDTLRDVTIKAPSSHKQVLIDPVTGEQSLFDKDTNTSTSIVRPPEPTIAADIKPEELLATMNPRDQEDIKGYAEYRLPISPYGIARDKNLNRLLPYIMKVNPNFNAAEYRQRQETMLDFAPKGKTGQNLNSLNTAINHLGHLEDLSKQVGGTRFKSWNELSQFAQRQVGANPALREYSTTASALEQEFGRMLKNGVATESEIRDWKDQLDPSQSPEYRQAAYKSMIALMAGRLDSIRDNYARIMGKPPTGAVFPSASNVLSRHGWDLDADQSSAISPSTSAPKTPAPPEWRAGMKRTDRKTGITKTYTGANPSDINDPANWQ